MSLRWRIALCFTLLAAVVFGGLWVYLEAAARRLSVASTQERLLAETRVVARILPPVPWEPGEPLRRLVKELGVETGARLTLIAPDGRVVADSWYDPAALESHADRPERLEALTAGVGSAVRRSGTAGLPMLYVAIPVGPADPLAWVLRLSVPLVTAEAAAAELRRVLALAFALAVLVIVLLSLRLAGTLTRPVQRLVNVARRVARGDLRARVETPLGAELAVLAAVFNDALDRLTEVTESAQREALRYAAVLEQMSDGVVVVDQQGRVQLVNRAFAEIFGLDPTWAQQRRLEEVSLSYELSVLLARAREQGTAQHAEISLARPRPRFLYGVATPLHDERGQPQGVVGLLRDLTEAHRLEQVRQEFVANASHELRTPAASIRALAEVLAEGALQDAEKGPHFVRQILAEADRLTRLLDDMLVLTRVERGAELLRPAWVAVPEAFAEAQGRVMPLAATRGVELVTQAEPEDQVWADAAGLQTVLINLLDNAVKYTPAGGRVTLAGRQAPGGYEITVTDTGVGIPAEHLPRIFERFYRVDKARDRATGGTGLGLSIVKHLAEAHGGRVGVDSTLGVGSTFSVFLPSPAGTS